MKRLIAALICAALLFCCAGCDETQPEQVEISVDLRAQIIADNLSESGEDTAAGAAWLTRYGTSVGYLAPAEYADSFRTDALTSHFELCFSKWNDAAGKSFLVTEAVYPDGKRYLCDLYELTQVAQLNTLGYAYERIKGDGRFSGGFSGDISNRYGESVSEYNLTELAPQISRSTLLGAESVRLRRILYGVDTAEKYAIRVDITADANGVRNVKNCNEDLTEGIRSSHLMNKSYWVGYSPNSGEFAIVNRQYEELILFDAVDTQDDTRRMPELFDVYRDELAVYFVRTNTGIWGYGIFNAVNQQHEFFEGDILPLGISGERLYLRYVAEDGSYSIGYRSLEDLSKPMVPLKDAGTNAAVRAGITVVSFSADGEYMVFLSDREDGVTEVHLLHADTGESVEHYEITGVFCTPRWAGFLSDGSVMVLSEKQFLCDEYLFIIDAGVDNEG